MPEILMTRPMVSTAADVRAVVQIAGRAPSLHNTQPWRWKVAETRLELWADRDRWLPTTDPDRHALLVSCGATLRLARLALDVAGWAHRVEMLPDVDEPDLLARITITGTAATDPDALALLHAALQRRSDRRPLDGSQVDRTSAEALRRSGREHAVTVHLARRAEEIVDLAVVTGWSDRMEESLEDIRSELARWVRADSVAGDAAADGVPASAIPRNGTGPRHVTIPQRDFEVGVQGGLLVPGAVDDRPMLAVLLTDADGDIDRLQAGEALAELLVVAQRLGIAACPVSQPVDLPASRERLRTLMGWNQHPQMLVRLGVPLGGRRPPLPPRRAVNHLIEPTYPPE
jgi:nitroreductase